MTQTHANALAIAPPAIHILIILNIAYAVIITGLLVWSFFIDGWPARPLGVDMVSAHPWVGAGLRAIIVIGIIGAVIVHRILKHLLAIVETVQKGDPFLMVNADRLNTIAWSVLSLEVLRLAVAGIAAAVWEPGRFEAFAIAPWLAVLLLFVLAGVFAHGARMRADLDGTV